MAVFDRRHRLALPGGYWLQKDDDNRWQVGQGRMFLALHISCNVPVGDGGSIDAAIKEFAEAMRADAE